jgi:hypothetical protein
LFKLSNTEKTQEITAAKGGNGREDSTAVPAGAAAGSRQVLLLFKRGGSRLIQSPHDGDGELHIDFAVPV